MKTILDFITGYVGLFNSYLNGLVESTFRLITSAAELGIRVILCVLLYKVAFENFLLELVNKI